MLCKQTSSDPPVFSVTDASHCCRSPSCARTVGLDISTRIGTGNARGCGEFINPDVEGGHCMTRITVSATVHYWQMFPPTGPDGDVELAAIRTTTTDSQEGAPIRTGDDPCGEITTDAVTDGELPELWDYETTTGEAEVTYEDCWTDEQVCLSAVADLTFGAWSDWEPLMESGDEDPWTIGIDDQGRLLSLYVARAFLGYALETKIRVRGAFPIAIAWYTVDTGGIFSEISREILEPGAERLFEAPSAANCSESQGFGETETVIACVCAVSRMDPG